MDFTEKTLSSEYIFNGEIINLRVDTVKTPLGTTATREIVEHPGGVCIVPMDNDGNIVIPLTHKGEVICVRQYRYAIGKSLLEIPAGKLFPGEDALECGKRELEEETGLRARKYISLGKIYPTPGFCGEIIHMYLALDLNEGKLNPDEDELIELEYIPLQKLIDLILSGEITDAKTCVALMKVNEMKNRGLI